LKNVNQKNMNDKWDWKGNPKATKEHEVLQLLKIIRPTKKDIFYDLGCGMVMFVVGCLKK